MLFNRQVKVAFSNDTDTLVFDQQLKITVRVSKSIEETEPDTCELEVYNLSKPSRDFIGSAKTVSVQLGYVDSVATVFIGDINNVSQAPSGPDFISSISAGNGSVTLQVATMNKSYVGGTKLSDPLKDMATSLGVDLEIVGEAAFQNSALLRGKSFTSDTKSHLRQLADEYDLDWSIQDDLLVILAKKEHRDIAPLLIDYQSGLLNSPELNYDDKTKTTWLKAVLLMNSSIRPADTVVVSSQVLEGDKAINVKRVVFNANSREGEFTTAIEGIIL